MKEEDMLRAMSQIDSDYVMEAEYIEQNKKHDPLPWKRYIAIAACVCFFVAGAYAGIMDLVDRTTNSSKSTSNSSGEGRDGYSYKLDVTVLYVDGVQYVLESPDALYIDVSGMTLLGQVRPYTEFPENTTEGIYADGYIEGANVYFDDGVIYLQNQEEYYRFIKIE